MAYEQRDNSGTLGKNNRKEKPSHPDHRGSAVIEGVDYWISAWVKEGPNGKFFSLAFQRKDQAPQSPQAKPQGKAPLPDLDDDIPF